MTRLLLNTFRWFDDALRQSLAAQGLPTLTHSQSLVMSSLTKEGIRISELARRLDMTRQGAQKSVAGLTESGLVFTETDPLNSSAKVVRLTDAGLENIAIAQAIFEKLEDEFANRIGKEHVRDLRAALELSRGDPPTIF